MMDRQDRESYSDDQDRDNYYIEEDTPVPMTHRVFVYGTLKRGHWNNHILIGAHFAGEATTPPMYRMLETGFPVILEDADGKSVVGELFHVDDATLARMDRLEGIRPDGSGMYLRKVIDTTERGHKVQAFIYVGNPMTWTDHGGNSAAPAYTKTNAAGALDWRR